MKKNSIFPIIVLVISVLEVVQSIFDTPNWLAAVNAVIGITGAILFFIKNENYRKLINVWIYLQAILIVKSVAGHETPVFDLTQLFELKVSMFLSFNETYYSIGFNFLVLIYLFVFKKLQIKELIGKQLTLKLYRDNDVLNDALPQTITVLEHVNYDKNEDWLLCQLTKPIAFNEINFSHCLIKSKDNVPIVPNQKSQMVHLRLVEEIGLMKVSPLKDNLFVDWAFVS